MRASRVNNEFSRREWLGLAAAAGAGVGVFAGDATAFAAAERVRSQEEPFGYCLNTATIRGQNLSLDREAELAAKVGYDALEPWIRELEGHAKSGRSLEELGRQFRDLGLTVESAIGFFEWAVDDDARRKKGLDEARRNLELVRAVGGKRLAAPPVGATDRPVAEPRALADRYRALLELGDEFGVVPQAEIWGFSKTLGQLGEGAAVAISADHLKACILPDVFHMYKGGSRFSGVRLLSKDAFHVFHMNDYPATPSREKANDGDRIFPGDGQAPFAQLFRDLRAIGYRGMLSIEVFNRTYYAQDAETVLRTGLAKLRTLVKASAGAERPK
jgi:2-keto-myo-inositol isomerase